MLFRLKVGLDGLGTKGTGSSRNKAPTPRKTHHTLSHWASRALGCGEAESQTEYGRLGKAALERGAVLWIPPGSAVSTWGLQTSPVWCNISNTRPWLVNLQLIMLELQATVSIVQAAVGFLAGCPPEQSLCPWCPPGHTSQAFGMGEG